MNDARPAVVRLPEALDPADVLAAFPLQAQPVLFDSALRDPRRGRYTFFSADPRVRIRWGRCSYGDRPLELLRPLARHAARWPRAAPLGGFQGGLAGVLSYELGGCFERVPRAGIDEYGLPDLVVGLYDWAIVWDHADGSAWFVGQRPDASELSAIIERLRLDADPRAEVVPAPSEPLAPARRHRWLLERLSGTAGDSMLSSGSEPTAERRVPPIICKPVASEPIASLSGTSDFSREEYLEAVERVREWIRAGDIFQANVSQRLVFPYSGRLPELYRSLRSTNPAPFAGFFGDEDWAILSASPERFLQCAGTRVQTRPIKGTRPRGTGPEADLFYGDELRCSPKDAAENVMIVDLLRNDLSRVCKPGSLRVTELCVVERFQRVQHLVSTVEGELDEGRDVWDLLAATLPGGSISGAPKIRAQQIIAELEPTVRGPYCGHLFYFGPGGRFDSNILIRSFIYRWGHLQCSVGGGVVIGSVPEAEYEETLTKAAGMVEALAYASRQSGDARSAIHRI